MNTNLTDATDGLSNCRQRVITTSKRTLAIGGYKANIISWC
jgi:hypothetical protein